MGTASPRVSTPIRYRSCAASWAIAWSVLIDQRSLTSNCVRTYGDGRYFSLPRCCAAFPVLPLALYGARSLLFGPRHCLRLHRRALGRPTMVPPCPIDPLQWSVHPVDVSLCPILTVGWTRLPSAVAIASVLATSASARPAWNCCSESLSACRSSLGLSTSVTFALMAYLQLCLATSHFTFFAA